MVVSSHAFAAHEVDLWVIPLTRVGEVEASLLSTLSPDERQRAARYTSPRARSQFVAGRSALRWLLGHYLEVPAETLRLSVATQGKPVLAEPWPLSFNLSHTDDLLLIALAGGMAVGVDVEKIRPMPEAGQLAERYFPPTEWAAAQSWPAPFLGLWTCRESAVKALGTGISGGWDSLRLVDLCAGTARAVGLRQDCQIQRLTPRPGYVAALAGLTARLQLRQTCTLSLSNPESTWTLA